MAVVVHGVKDALDQIVEMCTAVTRNIDALDEPSVEDTQTKTNVERSLQHLKAARESANVASQRRERTKKRGR